MEVDAQVLFAGIAVADFDAARTWYEGFFGHPPDVVAHANEVLWRITDTGWLYLVRDADHAGNSVVAVAVSDLDREIARLSSLGVVAGPIEPQGDTARKSVALDPEGNSIALIEVTQS